MLKFNNNLEKKLLLLQRNEFLSSSQIKLRKLFGRSLFTNFFINYFQDINLEQKVFYKIKEEFEILKKYLPRNVKNVMDIGCGIGLIDIFLNNYFTDCQKFYLLDKNNIDSKIVYGFSDNYESYSITNVTKNFLINNNIQEHKLNLIDVDKNFSIKPNSIDLCISLVSMGYHYPFSQYLDTIKKVSNNNTVFIFDIATEYQDISFLKNIFGDIKIIEESDLKHPRTRVACYEIIM
tara:strand:+ start:81 stop:785 length:705 start_codon:yes stop_codon:yes gene_type:complete